MTEEKISIPCGDIQLEGLFHGQEALSIKGGVILCHPHPLYGGDMDNTVIAAAVEAAYQEGFSTLRFNFRGVGGSGGSPGDGVREREDVKAAIDFFAVRLKDSDAPLVLLGYSFGAWAGIPVGVEDPRIKGMVAISPPLELYDFGFLKGCKKKKLIVTGSRDDYCPLSRLREFYEQIDEPKSLALIQGADHFYSLHQPALIKPLREFFKVL